MKKPGWNVKQRKKERKNKVKLKAYISKLFTTNKVRDDLKNETEH